MPGWQGNGGRKGNWNNMLQDGGGKGERRIGREYQWDNRRRLRGGNERDEEKKGYLYKERTQEGGNINISKRSTLKKEESRGTSKRSLKGRVVR